MVAFTLPAVLALASLVAASPVKLSRRQVTSVPDYVNTYAPLVWLHSTETYFPSDIGAQVSNTKPEINYVAVTPSQSPLTLDNLNSSLSAFNGGDLYLTSNVDPTTNPAYLKGVKPNPSTGSAKSTAIIINDKGNGQVDAFYMYFYAFNYGTTVLGQLIGNHIGDWEHTMVRFQDGKPTYVWFSQHDNGEAFTYSCLEKDAAGIRPYAYSANGSHANYAISGTHSHGIPNLNTAIGLINDYTDRGTLWDPIQSAYYYSVDSTGHNFAALDGSPTNWLYYTGHWGDEAYPTSDPRQHEILGISATQKWTGGPTGPEDKQLERSNVCPDNGDACILRTTLQVK